MVDDSLDDFLVLSELVAKTLKIGAGDLHANRPGGSEEFPSEIPPRRM